MSDSKKLMGETMRRAGEQHIQLVEQAECPHSITITWDCRNPSQSRLTSFNCVGSAFFVAAHAIVIAGVDVFENNHLVDSPDYLALCSLLRLMQDLAGDQRGTLQ